MELRRAEDGAGDGGVDRCRHKMAGKIRRIGPVSVEIIEFDSPNLIILLARPGIAEVKHLWRFTPTVGGTQLDQAAAMRPRSTDG